MEIWATSESFLPCWSSQRWRALVCVGLKTPLGPPSVVPITVMPQTGDTVKTRDTRTTFSRTHVYLMTLWCDIWGTAELQANNILISFFGLNVFSGSLLVMTPSYTRLLNYSSTVSERETPRRIYRGQEKKKELASRGGYEWEKKWEIKAHTHYARWCTHTDTRTDTRTEVLAAHVWS